MHMESFPQILFSVWESKITGRLLVKNDATEKTLTFVTGNIAVDKDIFEDKAFLKYLLQKKILDNPSAKKCEALTAKKKTYEFDSGKLKRIAKFTKNLHNG